MAFASSNGKGHQGQEAMAVVDQMRFKAEQYRKDTEELTSLLHRVTREKDEAIRMATQERSKTRELQDRLRQMEYQQSHNDQARQELRHQLLKAEDAMDYLRGQGG
jgi:predicted nuclease with TOPRIM domain